MSDLAKMAAVILDEDAEAKASVISVLAHFFQESFEEDPAGVGDWLARNQTSADLFVEFAALLRGPQEGAVPHE